MKFRSSSSQGPGWTSLYVEVDDVDASVNQALATGGAVLVPAYDAHGMRMAVVADPEGHPVGLSSEPNSKSE